MQRKINVTGEQEQSKQASNKLPPSAPPIAGLSSEIKKFWKFKLFENYLRSNARDSEAYSNKPPGKHTEPFLRFPQMNTS